MTIMANNVSVWEIDDTGNIIQGCNGSYRRFISDLPLDVRSVQSAVFFYSVLMKEAVIYHLSQYMSTTRIIIIERASNSLVLA